MYISSIISEDYKNWKAGKPVIIKSSTGSGKTHFVFDKLVREAKDKGKKVLYLCNRKTIKSQLISTMLNDKEKYDFNPQDHVYILTYQYCEQNGMFPNITIYPQKLNSTEKEYYKSIKKPYTIDTDDILYCIYDEAHYFLNDSTFNWENSF